jgi:hypothetical protein
MSSGALPRNYVQHTMQKAGALDIHAIQTTQQSTNRVGFSSRDGNLWRESGGMTK